MNDSYRIIDEQELIGVPFDWGGRDPKISLDCYGLYKFLSNQRGFSVPDYQTPSDKSLVNEIVTGKFEYWQRTEERAEGNIAVFRAGRYLHCGYILDEQRFVHTWEMSGGVTIEDISEWERRMLGIYKYVE